MPQDRLDPTILAPALLAGDRRALARAITLWKAAALIISKRPPICYRFWGKAAGRHYELDYRAPPVLENQRLLRPLA